MIYTQRDDIHYVGLVINSLKYKEGHLTRTKCFTRQNNVIKNLILVYV